MTQTELTTRFQSLFSEGQTPDMGAALNLLSEIQKDYDERDASNVTLNTLKSEVQQKDADIESLRKTNYNMFMTLGESSIQNPDPTQPAPPTTTTNTQSSPDVPETLFTEEYQGEKEILNVIDLLVGKTQQTQTTITPSIDSSQLNITL